MSALLLPPSLHTIPTETTDARWRVCLLGGVRLGDGQNETTHLPNRAVVALLALLALRPQRAYAREELIEMLWPGVARDTGRNRLRQVLHALRGLLAPADGTGTTAVIADRLSVRAAPGAFSCDALDFEAAARGGRDADALALYTGDLLPGFYDEWIDLERLRLAALFDRLDAGRAQRAPPASPQRLALGRAAARRIFPPAAAPGAAPGARSLPVYLTRFFGRDAESARLRQEVLDERLVTLLGLGGSGKTRLAVELAATLKASAGVPAAPFDIVAFVALVGCTTLADFTAALLASLRLTPQDEDAIDALATALDSSRVLLVLDNFEQLDRACAGAVAALLERVPGLHLLVTSRRVLGLDGEHVRAVSPLDLPATGTALCEAAMNPAVALFADRARAARADFRVSARNVDALVELTHLLEGLPLAIELAAARVRSIAPAEMAALLRTTRTTPVALELLARSGPRAGTDPRHASMLRAIEWSWRLLDAEQERVLLALTVFHGGFTARAAAAVCALAPQRAGIALDGLLAHSMLRSTDADGCTLRFSLFEPIREYAAARLDVQGAPALRARHRAWLVEWARTLPPTPVLAELRAEIANLRAALASAVDDGQPGQAIELMLALHRALVDEDLPLDALAVVERAVERCADPMLRSQGHTLLAPLLFAAGSGACALRHAEQGLSEAPPDPALRSVALYTMARVRWRATRDAQGLPVLLEEAFALAELAGGTEVQAEVLALRAFIAAACHADHAGAEALHASALALWEQRGNQHAIDRGRYNLACSAQYGGHNAQALARLAEVAASARRLHNWRRLAESLNVRGNALSGLRRWSEAVQTYRECIELAWERRAMHDLAYGLWNLPRALAHVRQPREALTIASFAARFWEMRFAALSAVDRHYLRLVRRLAGRCLDVAGADRCWAEGARLALPDAVALALQASRQAP